MGEPFPCCGDLSPRMWLSFSMPVAEHFPAGGLFGKGAPNRWERACAGKMRAASRCRVARKNW